MPIYEYYCYDCKKRVSVLFRTMAAAEDGASACPSCAGQRLRRLMSRLRVLRSEDNRIESMSDDPFSPWPGWKMRIRRRWPSLCAR